MSRARPRSLGRQAALRALRVLAFLAAMPLACGTGRPADGPHGPDDDELPDPKAPADLPDDPARPIDDGDKPLVDPAKEIAPPASPAGPASPAASASARPRR